MAETRTVDELGRVVIPSKLREQYGIRPKSRVVFVEVPEGLLIPRLDSTRCALCGTERQSA